MILIVGASGRLGGIILQRLLEQPSAVRVMTRNPLALAHLQQHGVEVVSGDLRDPASLVRACQGITHIIIAAHALTGTGKNTPQTVDGDGVRNLIATAQSSGVAHIIYTSALGASATAPIEFFRIKYQTEEYLRRSGLRFTILRPSAFMELWAEIIGQPLLEKGQTTIFGRGDNPINFVSVADVAQYACLALTDARAANAELAVGGPANLTLNQVAARCAQVLGLNPKNRHIPLPMMRGMALLLHTLNPAVSRQIAMGVYMDTANLAFDMTATARSYGIPQTSLDEVVQRLTTKVHAASNV